MSITQKLFIYDYKYYPQESEIQINGLCHITGGGFKENLNRIIPEDLKVNLNYDKIRSELPEVFKWIQNWGNIEWEEMC